MASRQGWGRSASQVLKGLFRAALDHVQQPGRAGAGADPGEVDDHGDVLVATAGVSPHVLIDADRGDAVEPTPVKIAVKVINDYGDEVMKVFTV
jgi:hypothetical protein